MSWRGALTAVTVALCATVAGPPIAHAAAKNGCQAGLRFAGTGSGTQIIDRNFRNPSSPQDVEGKPLANPGRLKPGHAYEVHGGPVSLLGSGSSYAVADGSIFMMDCHDAGDIDVTLGDGSVEVETHGRYPAGVSTPEGLFAPLTGGTSLRFTVKRHNAKPIAGADPRTLAALLGGVEDARVFGTTDVARVGRSKLAVNVTPYVGPREGDCRLVKSARLTSNGTKVGPIKGHNGVYRHLVGTARYHLA
jgi:hypothetical protein